MTGNTKKQALRIESQSVIGIFSSTQNAESIIKVLVEIGGFQPERFF